MSRNSIAVKVADSEEWGRGIPGYTPSLMRTRMTTLPRVGVRRVLVRQLQWNRVVSLGYSDVENGCLSATVLLWYVKEEEGILTITPPTNSSLNFERFCCWHRSQNMNENRAQRWLELAVARGEKSKFTAIFLLMDEMPSL